LFKRYNTITLLNALYHESRHAFQLMYTNLHSREYIDINEDEDKYSKQPIERDAVIFAIHFINLNKRKLMDIFNIDFKGLHINSNTLKINCVKYKEIK
ncbi:MAG: hypothetical protein PHF21_02645, partial [Bacilli bacterium]|nr:hypothetical protein [Bacilli bacterium]